MSEVQIEKPPRPTWLTTWLDSKSTELDDVDACELASYTLALENALEAALTEIENQYEPGSENLMLNERDYPEVE